MKILHMTLTKKWFDMIASGEKSEEYREIKPYWDKRLCGHSYDVVLFRNGYSRKSPSITIELRSIKKGIGKKEWGSPNYPVYILKLGQTL